MLIKSIDHLVITTEDVDQCLDFYVRCLGMDLDNTNNRVAVKFGQQKINIHRKKAEFQPAAKNVTYGSADICLIAEGDIEEIKKELLAKAVKVELGIVSRTGALGAIDSIYVHDPDGNLIEISVYRS